MLGGFRWVVRGGEGGTYAVAEKRKRSGSENCIFVVLLWIDLGVLMM